MFEVIYSDEDGSVSELLSDVDKVRENIADNLALNPSVYIQVYSDASGSRKRMWIDDLDELRRQSKRL